MQAVLDAPMTTDGLDQHREIIRATGEKIPDLGHYLAAAVVAADGLHHQDHPQPRPVPQSFQAGSLWTSKHAAADQATMFILEGITHRSRIGAAMKAVALTVFLYRSPGFALVGLEHEKVIATLV